MKWCGNYTRPRQNPIAWLILKTRYMHPGRSRKTSMAYEGFQNQPGNRVFHKSGHKKIFGYSLPEIMIALACSSLLMMILMNQYIGMKRYYKHAKVTLERGLDIQLVIDMLRDSIRQAGFTPCLGVEQLITLDTRKNQAGLTAVQIYPGKTSEIQINHMRNTFTSLINIRSPMTLEASSDHMLDRKKPIVIADCYHAEVHSVQDIYSLSGTQVIHLNHSLVYDFHEPVYIGEWIEESFFIRDHALYYRLGHADMLSSAIHDIHVSASLHQGKRLVHLDLFAGDDQALQVDTLVRTS